MDVFLTVCMWVILGFATAHVAEKKGRDPMFWFAVGLLLGIFGLGLVFFLPQQKKAEKPSEKRLNSKMLIPEKAIKPKEASCKPWFYLTDEGEQVGPITFQELMEKKKAGIISESSYVWSEGMEEWCQLGKLEIQGEADDE